MKSRMDKEKELFEQEVNTPAEIEGKPLLDSRGQLDVSDPDAVIAAAFGLHSFKDVAANSRGVLKRLDLYGGPVDEEAWDTIRTYIATGSRGNLEPREQHLLNLLTLIYNLDGQFGKRNTIRFLVSNYFDFSYEQAAGLYSQAVELLYTNRQISKDALRAKTADQLEAAYIAAFNAARTAKDYRDAAEILKMKASVLGLDRDDPQVLDVRTYQRSWRVLSLTPESIGLPAANRRDLAQIIDALPGGESDKRRLKMEAGIIDVDIVGILNNESQEAN